MARGDASGYYQPEDIGPEQTVEQLASFVQRELRRISQAINLGYAQHLDPLHVPPSKPRDGDIAFADGIDWNPGSGVGAYIFYAGAWHPFGGAGAPGAQGQQGNIGSPGMDGGDGEMGMPIPGNPGPTGQTGAQGLQGNIGPPGWINQDDPESVFPIPGPQGLAGTSGAAGPVGPVILPDNDTGEMMPVGFNDPESNPRAVVTPAVPATTVAVVNSTGRDVTVYIKAGTLTVITVGGTATGIAAAAAANTAHSVPVKRNQTIAITYTVAPTWVWVDN